MAQTVAPLFWLAFLSLCAGVFLVVDLAAMAYPGDLSLSNTIRRMSAIFPWLPVASAFAWTAAGAWLFWHLWGRRQ